MRWPDQTLYSAVWTVDGVGVYSAGACEAAEAGTRRLFLKKIRRVVVDFDEEL